MDNKQIKYGAVLNYIAIGLNLIVGLLYTPYMLRMLGQNEYGLYSLVASVISYLTLFDLGFGNAIIRYSSKNIAEGNTDKEYRTYGMFIKLYSLIGVVVMLIGVLLFFNVDAVFNQTMNSEETGKARIMVGFLVFNLALTFPMSVFTAAITSHERFVFLKSVSIIRVLLNTLVIIALLHLGYKAVAMVMTQTFFNVLTPVIGYIYCKTKLNIKVIFGVIDWKELKEILLYSVWIVLCVVVDKVYLSSGQIILGIKSGTQQIAIYAIAIQLLLMFVQFSTAISSLFLPRLTKLAVEKNLNEISNIFIKVGNIQFCIVCFILMSFCLLGEQFISLWAGEDYSSAYYMAVVLLIPYTIDLIQNIGTTILQARNQLRFRTTTLLIMSLLCIILEIYTAEKWGGLGCACSVGFCVILGHVLILNYYYWKKQSIQIPQFWILIIRKSIPALGITILAYCFMQYLEISICSWGSFIMVASAFSAIYMLTFYLLSLNKQERLLIKKTIRIKK
ncbi:MAG: oligosaccharide flippase family protein [Eubacteriales bacterium]|nr:oligosaccharide flippase family protein [Eubacteriales bacterium]